MEFHINWRISMIMKWLTAKPARRGKVYPPTGADEAFIHTTFNQIDGWCRHEAAYLTCCLMASQKQAGLAQGVVEIGVWKGKYLSVLYHNARQYGQPVVGIDEFVWLPREDAVNALEKAFGSLDGLKLIPGNSRHVTAADIFEMLGGLRASFISVDGDHAAPAVKSDLELASAALAPGGIMAIDDFMNPHAMSVSEAVYGYFFETQSSIRPFAYTGNKLFAADSAYHARYIEAVALFAEHHEHLPIVKEYNEFRAQGSYYVEQRILGSTVIVL